MQEFELKKQEVECINHFLDEVSANQLLAGVYILAYTKNDEQLGELVVVKKPCKYYLAGLKDPIVISEEYHNHLMQAVEELRSSLMGSKISLVVKGTSDYSYGLMHVREQQNARDLLSSTILLDFDDFTIFTEKISKFSEPWKNAIKISNVSLLLKKEPEKVLEFSRKDYKAE